MGSESEIQNPYIGPRPFERKDQNLFFGRDVEVSELLSLIIAHREVLLYAPSGAGKTSLLNAGLFPLLEREGFEILPIARVRGLESEDVCQEDISNIYVYNTLMSWAEDNVDRKQIEKMSLSSFLENRKPVLSKEGLPVPRLILFDQFEELFTFYQERWKEREEFFQRLSEALKQNPLLRVVFIMREDYLASLDPYSPFLPKKLRTRYRLDRLNKEAACLAVEGPLQGTRCSFSEGVAGRLVDELIKIRVECTTGETIEAAGEYVEPVQLQVVCQTLWANLPQNVSVITQDHLNIFGNVDEALKDFYQRAVRATAEETEINEGDLSIWVESHLITSEGTRGTVSRGKDKTGGIPNATIDSLENHHVIRAEMRAGARWYELTHDRLIDPIKNSNKVWHEQRHLEAQKQELEAERQRTEEERRRAEEEQRRAEEQTEIAARLRWGNRVLVVLVLLAIGAGVFAFFEWRRAEQHAKLASSRALATAAINQARNDPELGVLLALHAVEAARPLGGDSMREAVDALGRAINPARLRFTKKLDGPINKVALSPDQKRLVVALDNGDLQVLKWPEGREEMALQGRDAKFWKPKFAPTGKLIGAIASDNTVRIWNAETGILQHKLTPPGQPVALSFNADGSMIAIGGAYTAWVWRLGDENPVRTLSGHVDSRGIPYTVTAVAFHPHPDKPILATAAYDETIRLWNLQSRKQVALLQGHTATIDDLEFSPDGQELLSASQDFTARIWNVATERNRVTLYGHSNSVFSASYSRDGKKILTGSADATARIWDAESGREIVLLSPHTEPVSWARFAIDDRQVMSASWDGTVKTWSASGHIGRTVSLWFSPDGSVVATAGEDRTIRLWAAASGEELRVLTGHRKPVTCIRFSDDGMRLASGDASGRIEVWEPSTGKNVASLCCHSDGIESIAFSPDGSRLVSAAGNDGVALWNFSGGVQMELLLKKPSYLAEKVAFSPDGQWIAASTNDGKVRIWKAAGPRGLCEWRAHTVNLHVLAFSPDSKMLMTAAEDHLVKLWWQWDVAPGKIRHEMRGHEAIVMSGLFVPDGSRIITSDLSGEIIVWDTGTGGRLEGPPRAHRLFSFLDLSRDGTRLASFSWDRTAKVWDTKFWRELATLTHWDQVDQGAISPDGMRIATATPYDGVRIVPLDTAELIRLAKTRVTRDLKADECLRYLQRKDCPPLPR